MGHGVVTGIWEGRFGNVPARLLEFEHELESSHVQRPPAIDAASVRPGLWAR